MTSVQMKRPSNSKVMKMNLIRRVFPWSMGTNLMVIMNHSKMITNIVSKKLKLTTLTFSLAIKLNA
jgi:hypothetical protein